MIRLAHDVPRMWWHYLTTVDGASALRLEEIERRYPLCFAGG